MQSVTDAFSVEEVDAVRRIGQSTAVSWKKDFLSSITIFTVGSSSIGDNDIIGGQAVYASAWDKYVYEDESDQVLSLSYERELNIPTGGLVKAMADFRLDNTSGRYTPHYVGGTSAIFTAVDQPRKPVIINAGFEIDGVDDLIPQFVGVTTKPPVIDYRNRTADFHAEDFIAFIQNKYVEDTAMFTAQTTDVVLESILQTLGFATSQYDLDPGVNVIGFGQFNRGDKFGNIVNKLVQAEDGHFYQDEQGKLRFENRQHWDNAPYTQVQRIITTSQVINSRSSADDHLINVVEINAKPMVKQPLQLVWTLASYKTIPAGSTLELFVNFDDPMLQVLTPENYSVNTASDGSGSDASANISITYFFAFARAAKIVFTNSSALDIYLTELTVYGRPAKVEKEIYYRAQDDSSVTAYEERIYSIENDYIQDITWARSFAQLLLEDYSVPSSIQTLTVRSKPELQLGDLVGWQGQNWRVIGIKTKIDPSVGFVQDLRILKRGAAAAVYFRIGISTIAGTDKIAP